MDKTALTALIGVAGTIVGTLLGIWIGDLLAYKRKRRDELHEMRLKAYADFIRSASRLAVCRRTGKIDDEIDELAALNDAKCRIIISADAKVVKALIDFWKPVYMDAGGTLETEYEIVRFSLFCHAVRDSLKMPYDKKFDLMKDGLPVSDALFQLEPANFSYKKYCDDLTRKKKSCASPEERPKAAA
jgi:hypothetical protein